MLTRLMFSAIIGYGVYMFTADYSSWIQTFLTIFFTMWGFFRLGVKPLVQAQFRSPPPSSYNRVPVGGGPNSDLYAHAETENKVKPR